jgi:hypothetical protein
MSHADPPLYARVSAMDHTPHATRHTPHTTHHTPHATRHTPHATRWGDGGRGGVAPASHRSVQQRWWKEVTALRLLTLAIAALRGVLPESKMGAILECRRSKERLSMRNIFLNVASCSPISRAQTDWRNSPLETSLRCRLTCDKTLFTSFELGRFKGARPYIAFARIHLRQLARALT